MIKSAVCLTVLLIISYTGALQLTERKFLKRMFKTYEARFGKKYSSAAEFNYRAELYEKRMDDMEKFNKENESWQKGETIFTDMTEEEREHYLGLFVSPEAEVESEEESFPQSTEGDESMPLLSGPVSAGVFDSLPKRVNWVEEGVITPVKAQGACGSCWAFTATALVESLYKKKYGYDLDLSEQELVDCATASPYLNYGCKGGFNSSGLNYYKIQGSHLETQYRYTGKNGTCRRPTTPSYKISQFNSIKPRSLSELLKALAQGPVAVAYYVAYDFYDYRSGVYNHKAGCKNATTVNHAVLAVGYDLNAANPYILFKNSWGTYFGENGYFKMSIDLVDYGYGPCNLLKFGMSVSATL